MAGGWNHHLLANPVPGDVEACVIELGIEVKRVTDSGDVEGMCPVHYERVGKVDRKGKWAVNIDTGLHNCFSCGFSGKFVHLVGELLGVEQEEAVAWIKARGSIERARRTITQRYVEKKREEEEITEADLALYTEVPDEICATRDIDGHSADFYGVLWDPKKKAWITPVRSPLDGTLMGWQVKGKGFFLNEPTNLKKSVALFGYETLDGLDTAILVESPLDCPRIHTAGLMGAVASFGAKISQAQVDLLCNHPDIRVIVSALDNDEAGDEGNAKLRHMVRRRVRIKYWNYGDMDVSDPGEQTDEEINWSYDHALSSLVVRF